LDWQAGLRDHSFLDHMDLALVRSSQGVVIMRNIHHEVLQVLSGLFTTRQVAAHKAVLAAPSATCGAFTLPTGRAIRLRPPAKAVLRIVQGGAWVTLPSQPGDHFLRAGDSLQVRAGDDVVMEGWRVPAGQALCFDWDARPAHPTAKRSSPPELGKSLYLTPRQHQAALAPLTDLRAALLMCSGR
jgi:hypothetical protein